MERSPDIADDRASDAGHVLVALTQQRVRAFSRFGVCAQSAVKSDSLAGSSDNDAEHGGQCEHEQHPIPSLWGSKGHVVEREAEAPILLISEPRFRSAGRNGGASGAARALGSA
jgi:hypothetical protein